MRELRNRASGWQALLLKLRSPNRHGLHGE